ncbi:MAG: hypothetical protein KDD27_10090, partial [Saprospiraceae bacterium]|nr:hypothetical protein [Saprospiraceae bacterium]
DLRIHSRMFTFRLRDLKDYPLELIFLEDINISGVNIFYKLNNIDKTLFAGTPIFDLEWDVFAIHETGFEVSKDQNYQGVLIAPILQDIERQKGNDSSTYAA